MDARTSAIVAAGRAVGFALTGAAPLAPLPRDAFLTRWLAEGRAGEMAYLAERLPTRLDPRVEFPWARSIVMGALRYPPPPPLDAQWRVRLSGRIAAYALGVDYHDRVRTMLAQLADRLGAAFPAMRTLPYVDTGPLLEREWARRGGVGWTGRHTLVLHRALGSYFVLGALLTDLEVEPLPLPEDHCGTCRRCLTACPTGALEADYVMEPRRCISYLTIEQRGPIPAALRPALDNWIFGCDLCQQACPWNADGGPAWSHELTPALPALLALDEAGFRARYRRTALWRAKRTGIARNVAVALGNSRNPAATPALARAVAADPSALVRAHAAWALGRLEAAAARRALDDAWAREDDVAVRAEVDAALGGAQTSA